MTTALHLGKDGVLRARDSEEHTTTGLLNAVMLVAVAAVAYTDWIVAANVSLGYLYVLPIALCALIDPPPVTLGLAVVCTVLQDIFAPPESASTRVVRAGIALAGYLMVGFLVTLIAEQRDRLAADVRRQRDEYEHDLELAAEVQRRVLSRPPTMPRLELAAAMRTARLLGGDYYDFFQISEDVVDVVIADVSGKGAAASLLMPSLAVVLRLRARELNGPAAILKDLDGVLKQITDAATFVTMFYARFDQAKRTLEYASGGHNPPLLVRPRTGEALTLAEAGPILGILPETQFANTVVPLEPGDMVAFFTDGVTEQENANGVEFSVERLESLVVETKNEPAAAAVRRIADAVSAYAGAMEQTDDLTIVLVKVT